MSRLLSLLGTLAFPSGCATAGGGSRTVPRSLGLKAGRSPCYSSRLSLFLDRTSLFPGSFLPVSANNRKVPFIFAKLLKERQKK